MNIDNEEKYLYEIIDEYKHSSSDREKGDIFKSFCSAIWLSNNKRRVYTKTIRFTVRKDLLNTDIGQVFDAWSDVEYKGYKSMTKEADWCSLIRQKINNLYTIYIDKEVVLKKDYIELLSIPKKLYYQWIGGIEMKLDDITIIIDDAISNAKQLKTVYQEQKIKLSWDSYVIIIENFLQKIFDNCILIEDYERKGNFCNIYDFTNEDNFYIRYFCRSLETYMQNYNKEYYGLKRGRNKKYRRCIDCNGLFELHAYNQHRCVNCQKQFTRKIKTEKQRKYRVEKLNC